MADEEREANDANDDVSREPLFGKPYDDLLKVAYRGVDARFPPPREDEDTIRRAFAYEEAAAEPIMRMLSRDRQPDIEWLSENRRDDDVGIVVDDVMFRVTVFQRGRFGIRVLHQLELRPMNAPAPLVRTIIDTG